MNTHGGGGIDPRILNIDIRGEWSASHSGRFTSGEIDPGTHWIGGWVGPRVDLDDVVGENLVPTGIQTQTFRPSSLCYMNCAVLAK
jgi:hypothetical protein